MRSQSLEAPTLEDHIRVRDRYARISWEIWASQQRVDFYIWDPRPEVHLATEVKLFWRGEIDHIHGWSDIVGQIVQPIKDAFNAILSWFWKNVIKPGIEIITGALEWVLKAAIGVVEGIVNSISSAVGSVWNWLKSVGAAISTVVQGIASALAAGIAGLSNAISGAISTIISNISSVVGLVSAAIQAGLSWVGEQLTEATSWIWDQLSGLFSALGDVLKQIGQWIVNGIKTYVVDPILGFLKPVFEGLQSLIMALFDFMTGGAVTGSPIEWRGSFIRWLGILSGVGIMAVGSLIGAELINLIHPFKDTKAGEIAKFAMQFSGVAFLQAAFFTTYFDIACAKPVRQELNAIFTPEIPGSGDLILFVVREVIDVDVFYEALGLQGFSKFWSEAYWEAHWLLPPPERTRTAFLRKQIDEGEYKKFLVWYDFKPEPRPGISKSDVDIMLNTQYELPGRIDTRWLLEWGSITPEDGLGLIKAGGAAPEWAPKLLEVYLLNQVREELGKVRAVYERRLKSGFMNKTDFAMALHSIHYAAHVINALTTWADEALDLEEKEEIAAEYEKLALEGVDSVEIYGNNLRSLGMVEEMITRRMKHVKVLLAIKAHKAAK